MVTDERRRQYESALDWVREIFLGADYDINGGPEGVPKTGREKRKKRVQANRQNIASLFFPNSEYDVQD